MEARAGPQADLPGRNGAQGMPRLVQRCVISFLVDEVARMSRRHDGDIVGGAVFLAIKQATSPYGRQGSAQVRAVSVRAVAQSLGFSYETTRRRVIALELAGRVRRLGDAGVSISPGAIELDGYRQDAAVTHRELRKLYAALARLGAPFPAAFRAPVLPQPELDLAIANHCDDFALRVIEIGTIQHASSIAGVVFAAFMSANASPITYDYVLARRYGSVDTPPPDNVRRPATITEVAMRLGIPHEVARRRVLSMLEDGKVRRVTGGYLINVETLQSPQVIESGMLINQRFVQMTQALLALGVDASGAVPIP
jgi:DNA-binding Lrp family transcriptional regulator